jgi:hypothetical protein
LKFPSRLPLGGWLVLAAAGVTLAWFASLHPLSGALGGLYFLLVGWAMPSMPVALLAIGLSRLVPAPLPARMVLAAIQSILFGLNTALPKLPRALGYNPDLSQAVTRTASIAASKYKSLGLPREDWPPMITKPLQARLRVGSDEGCGCMYFLPADDIRYVDRLLTTMREVTGSGSITTYETLPQSINEDLHVSVKFLPNGGRADAVLTVVDRGQTIATFTQRGLPDEQLPSGVGREKLAENFWENAMEIFLRDNLWTAAAQRMARDYFPQDELRDFFRQAVRR